MSHFFGVQLGGLASKANSTGAVAVLGGMSMDHALNKYLSRSGRLCALVSGLVLFSPFCSGSGTLDFNSLQVNVWHASPDASIRAAGAHSILGLDHQSHCFLPGTSSSGTGFQSVIPTGAGTHPVGMGISDHWAGTDGTGGVRLLTSNGSPTGWTFKVGYPSYIPFTSGGGLSSANFAIALEGRGPDLVPGTTYKLDLPLQVTQHFYNTNGSICATLTSAIPGTTFTKTQSATGVARIAYFDGVTINSGVVADNSILGQLRIYLEQASNNQTASVRWSASTFSRGEGGFSGDRYTVLTNGVGGRMTVGLDCAGRNGFMSTGQSPNYIYSDSGELTCKVVKGGDESVSPGEYKMSIQGAVRTP